MNAFKQFLVIVRPIQCLTAAFATIAFAVIATRQLTLSSSVLAAAYTVALLVFASSVYHCAFQNHGQPFTRRVNDFIPNPRPWIFGPIAVLAFIGSVVISLAELPLPCTLTIVSAAVLVVLYTRYRGTKTLNPLAALICTTPVLVGWLASGSPVSGWTYFFMVFAYLVYLVREDAKDSQEVGVACDHILRIRERSYSADWGGATGWYFVIPMLGTVFFASHYFCGSSPCQPPGWVIPLSFVTYGIMAFGNFSVHLKKRKIRYPQAIMTAFVWMYLSVWIAGISMA